MKVLFRLFFLTLFFPTIVFAQPVSVELSALPGAEGGSAIQFVATLDALNNTGNPITFTLSDATGTATVGSDYTSFNGTIISIPDGSISNSVSVSITDDALFESTETVNATIANLSNPSLIITTGSASANLVDNDTMTADLSGTDGTEAGTAASFLLTLSKTNNTGSALIFPINSDGGIATAGVDYTDFDGQNITIPNGQNTGSLPVTITNDTLFENDETLIATLGTSPNPAISITTGSATVDIIDNDNTTGSIAANLSVTTHGTEGGSNIEYTVTLAKTNDTALPIDFVINPSGGTAISGTDYTDFPAGIISVDPGESTGTFIVTVTDDNLFENLETVQATISAPSDGAIAIGTASATANITDTDTANLVLSATVDGDEQGAVAIQYTATLSSFNGKNVPITFLISPTSGTATVGSDYLNFSGRQLTIAPGQNSVSTSVLVSDDSFFEGDETVISTISAASDPGVTITGANATANIIDNDDTNNSINANLTLSGSARETGATTLTYVVTLAKKNFTGSPITFNLGSPGGTATTGDDYTDITGVVMSVPNGSDTASHTITIVDDTLFENTETFSATISGASHPAINIVTATASGSIVDNDNTPLSVDAVLGIAANGAEPSTKLTFSVTLSEVNNTHAPISFKILGNGGTATAGPSSDYVAFSGGTISVPHGSAVGTLDVTVNDDSLFEDSETVGARIFNPSDAAISIITPSASGSILDDDNSAVTADLTVTQHANESGNINFVYTVTLSKVNHTGSGISFAINPSGGTAIAGLDYVDYTGSTISVGSGSATGTFTGRVTNDNLFENVETASATI